MLSDSEVAAVRARFESRRRRGEWHPNKLTPEQREQLLRDFIDGASPVDLARAYGIKRQTVDYHIKKAVRSDG